MDFGIEGGFNFSFISGLLVLWSFRNKLVVLRIN